MLLGLAVLASPFLREPGARPFRRGRALLVVAAAYVLLLLVSIAFSQDPRVSLTAMRELFTLAALPLALAAIQDERRLRSLFDALILVAVLLAVFGLAQFLFGYGQIDRRIRGPFSHVMTFSGVLLLLDLLLIARCVTGPKAHRGATAWLDRPWVRWSALVLVNAALMNTLTRSAWLGLLSGILTLLVICRRSWLLAIPAAAVLFLLFAPVPVIARVLSIANFSDESTYDRLCMVEAGIRMTAAHPLTGLGPEIAERRYPIYRHPTASRLNVPHLHNSYVQLAAERGLPALAAYLALFVFAIRAAWIAYLAEREGGRPGARSDLHLGMITALVAYSVAGLFENNWGDTEVQRMVLFLLAVPFCLRPVEPSAAVEKR
jgi:O-antigen ligase